MRRWEAKERWRRRDEEGGGCLRQQIADALWELADRFDVAVDSECNVVINGVVVSRPRCRAVDECVRQMLEEYKKRLESPPPPPRPEGEDEYETLLQQYVWLGWWNKNLVKETLRHHRQALLDLLNRLNAVPHFVAGFIGRFELDLRCIVEIFSDGHSYCVGFCIKDARPVTYCYEPGKGWRAAPQPKFLRLRPLGDRLAEIYAVGDRELVKIA
jgi:hypothetical protein